MAYLCTNKGKLEVTSSLPTKIKAERNLNFFFSKLIDLYRNFSTNGILMS